MIMAVYAALMCLALGLFTSMTFLALTHILLVVPAFYFIPKTDFKKINWSAWFLLCMAIAFALSVLFNQNIATNGFSPLTKTKYYFIAFITIAPISYFFSQLNSEESRKKINSFLLALLITTTLAGFLGSLGVWFGFNPVKWHDPVSLRNRGFAGMVLNYAHNLAMVEVVLTGMIFYRNEIKKYINLNFLYICWAINLVALYLTASRGPLLAFIAALPFYFFKSHKKIFIGISVAFILFATIAFNTFANKTLSRHESDLGRISQWKAAVAGFKERPILGLGYLNFEPLSRPLKIKYHIEQDDFGGHGHSNYFETLASTGIIGFVFFMLWQIAWFVEMYKRNDVISNLALPFIVCFIVGGLTQATFILGANLFLIMSAYTLTQINVKILKEKN